VAKTRQGPYDKNWTVQLECTHQFDAERLKPDITAERDNTVMSIDVTVPYERSRNAIDDREKEKERKYGRIPNTLFPGKEIKAMGIAVRVGGTTNAPH
jgi:hypothetical protein